MITVAEASERILERISPLPGETVATGTALGRVLAEAIIAGVDSPPWDNSSMDGFAVRAADLSLGAALRVSEEVAAGAFPSRGVVAGEAIKVMTGAPVPAGADTVVRREDVVHEQGIITINNLRDAGKNIRLMGEDFRAGDKLFSAGEKISAGHIGAIASAGIQRIPVHRRPNVAVISSGDELVRLEDFSPGTAGKKVVSSNSLTLPSLVEDAGGIAHDLGIARDDPVSLREKFDGAAHADLIITTAGMSVGDHDHVRDVFASLGGELVFWKVRMRPGAPMAFGFLSGVPWVGLSGNPVSAIVSFEVFVRPVIRRMLGLRSLFRRTIPVRTAHSITLAASLMHFLRVIVKINPEGTYDAEIAGSQSSGVLTAIARSNALLILPGDRLAIGAGETHRALPLSGDFGESDSLVLE